MANSFGNGVQGAATATIQIVVKGASVALSQINKFSGEGIGSITKLAGSFLVIKAALQEFVNTIQPAYSLLIGQNDLLNQQLIKSQTALANTTKQFTSFGTEITGIGDKLNSTRERLKDALIQVQKDTRDLVGVTTQDVNSVFNTVLTEGASVLSSQTNDVVGAAVKLSKGVTAALGTIGLPLQQVQQEFRALINGDLKNPDALLVKSLGIDKSAFERARSTGKLVEFLTGKLEAYVEAQKQLAKTSVDGAISNIQSAFEDLARTAGEPLLEPFVQSLNDVYKLINDAEPQLEQLAKDFGPQLVGLFESFRDLGSAVAEAIGPVLASNAKSLPLLVSGFTDLANLLTKVVQALKPFTDGLAIAISLTVKAIETANNVKEQIAGGVADSQRALETIANATQLALEASAKSLKEIAELRAKQNLTPAEKQRLDFLLAQQGAQVDLLNSQKEAATQVRTFGSAEAKTRSDLIAKIDAQIDSAKKLGDANAVAFGAKDLATYGNTITELKTRLDDAVRNVKAQGNGQIEIFQKSSDEAAKLVNELYSLGQLDLTQATGQLRALIANPATDPEKRIEYQKQLLSLFDQEATRKKQLLTADKASYDLQVANGKISAEQGQLSQLGVQKQEILADIDATQGKLKEALSQGNAQLAKELTEKLSELGIKLKQIATNSAEIKLTDALKKIGLATEQANKQIEQNTAERNIAILQLNSQLADNEQKLSADQLASETKANDSKLANAKANLASLEKLSSAGLSQEKARQLANQVQDAKLQVLQLEQTSIQLATQGGEAQRAILTRRVADVQDANKQEQASLEAQLQAELNAEQISQTKRNELLAKASKQRLQTELKAQQELLAELEKQKPTTRADQLGQEKAVREAKLKTSELTLSLLQAEQQAEEATAAVATSQLDKRLAKLKLLSDKQQAEADNQQKLAQLAESALQRQTKLLQTRQIVQDAYTEAIKAENELRLSQLSTAKQLAESYKEAGFAEKKLIRERLLAQGVSASDRKAISKLADAELEATRRRQQIEANALLAKQQADQEALRIQLQLEQIQARQAENQAKQNELNVKAKTQELQLELAKAQLIGDKTERDKTVATLTQALSLQKEAESIAAQQVADAQQSSQIIRQSAQSQLQGQQIQQQSARFIAQQQGQDAINSARLESARTNDKIGLRRVPQAQASDALSQLGAIGRVLSQANANTQRQFAQSAIAPQSKTTQITNVYNAPLVSRSTQRALGI